MHASFLSAPRSLPSLYYSLTCRQRKLKCDETRPICGQCAKANRHCQPSTGITFRHQHNASMNSPGDGAAPLNRFYAYKNTFDNATTWVDIPRDLTFYNTTDPYADDVGIPTGQGRTNSHEHTPYMQSQSQPWSIHQQSQLPSGLNAHGLEALSAAALYSPATANMIGRPSSSSNHEHPSRSTPVPDHSSDHLGSSESPNASNNNLNYILNSPPNADSPIDPSLMSSLGTGIAQHPNAPPSPLKPPAGEVAPIEGAVESEHKMAYLLRHFSETPGQWLAHQESQSKEGS